jgi:phosphoribosyl 1,2-cyclic phosphate phosphodiesterase
MRLLFLGTAAAEGYPGIFCDCDYCREARALGGINLRFRSALLVNQDLLIDFGPDLLAASQRFNISLAAVTTGLITHAHSDHFYLGNFEMRRKPFTAGLPIPTLNVFGPTDAVESIHMAFPDMEELRMMAQAVVPFKSWETNGYEITPYQAYHAVNELTCVFYSISDGKHNFLYATDTGPFPEATWQALSGRSFDVIILEETLGSGTYSMHLGFDTFLDHFRRFAQDGLLKPGGRVIAHHLSHSGNPPHAKVESILKPHGVEVAYDGMVVDLS